MAFTNGQNVQANDLNNLSITSLTTTADVTVGDDLVVTDDASVGGDLSVTGALTVGGQAVGVPRNTVCGRLSLTTGTAVTTADVTAATTLYWALYLGNHIALYNGTSWQLFAIAQLSIAVPATTNTGYDVFVDYNSGTPALAVTAWSSLTARATALTTQDGVLVLTGTPGKRYVGSFRTTGVSGQTEDSVTKRYVWNYYNRVPRKLQRLETTASWTYTTATVRQANGAAANQVETFVGVAEVEIDVSLNAQGVNDAGNSVSFGIGEGSTTTFTEGAAGHNRGTNLQSVFSRLLKYPAIGYQFWSWNEWSQAAGGTSTFYGTESRGDTISFGLRGTIDG